MSEPAVSFSTPVKVITTSSSTPASSLPVSTARQLSPSESKASTDVSDSDVSDGDDDDFQEAKEWRDGAAPSPAANGAIAPSAPPPPLSAAVTHSLLEAAAVALPPLPTGAERPTTFTLPEQSHTQSVVMSPELSAPVVVTTQELKGNGALPQNGQMPAAAAGGAGGAALSQAQSSAPLVHHLPSSSSLSMVAPSTAFSMPVTPQYTTSVSSTATASSTSTASSARSNSGSDFRPVLPTPGDSVPVSPAASPRERAPMLTRQMTVEQVMSAASLHRHEAGEQQPAVTEEQTRHARKTLGLSFLHRLLHGREDSSGGNPAVRVKGRHKDVSVMREVVVVQSKRDHMGPVWVVSISQDGQFLATGGQDSIVRVWAIGPAAASTPPTSAPQTPSHSLAGPHSHTAPGSPASSSHASSFAYLSAEPIACFSGHKGDVIDLSWSVSHFLLSASVDRTARLWHISRPAAALSLFHHPDFVTAVHFHPLDERFFLSACFDKKVRVWSIVDHRVMEWSQVQDIITSARYDRKGEFVMVGSHTGTVNVLRGGMGSAAGQSAAAASASSTQADGAEAGLRYVTEVVCRNHSGKYSDGRKVTGLDFNSDLMLVTTNDSRLRVFSVSSHSVPRISLLCKLKGITNLELQIKGKFSEDGRLVVCGSEDGHIAVWELPPEVTERSRRGDSAPAKVLKINAREEFQAMGSIVTSAQFLSRKAITEVKGGKVGGEQETPASRQVKQAVIAGSYQGEVKVFESRAVMG